MRVTTTSGLSPTLSATASTGGVAPSASDWGAVSSHSTGRPSRQRIATATGPAPSSNTTSVSAPDVGTAPIAASTNAVPTFGWPANGISAPGVKMRTLRVCAGSSGGSTKVVSE